MHESNTPTNKPLDGDEARSSSVEIANNQSLGVNLERLVSVTKLILVDHNFNDATISLAIVDDKTIHELNARYLNHDYETDVLSFVLDRNVEDGSLEGEVIASADTADRVAKEFGIQFQDELLLYIVHGVLHLVGYDDKERGASIEMRAAEKKYTQLAGAEYREPELSAPESSKEETP